MAPNGELVLAHPVALLGDVERLPTINTMVALITHDGYILENPNASQAPWFFNRKCEEFMEDLGEL